MVGDVAHLSQMTILAITGFIKHFYHNRVHLLKARDPQKPLLVHIAETLRFLVVGRFLLLDVSCSGQRNRLRPVPVPVTGVCYNSLL